MLYMLMLLLVCLWLEARPVNGIAHPPVADPASCPEQQHSLAAKHMHRVHE